MCCFDRIAEVTSPNGWDLRNFYQWSNWRNRGDLQRSDMMDLSNGNSYLLVANFKEGGGADFLRVRQYSTVHINIILCLNTFFLGWSPLS